MYTSLVSWSLVLVTMTSATTDNVMLSADDGSGVDVVTGTDMVGQVLLSARLLGMELDRLTERFESDGVAELEAMAKKLNGNYEMVTDAERKYMEEELVSLAQATHNAHRTKKSLAQLGSDIVTRVNSVRTFLSKTLSPTSSRRTQQAGIRFIVVKSTQMLKALMDPLEEATRYQTSLVEYLTKADTYLGNFTSVLTSMADTEGERFKNMKKSWIDLYFGNILSSKMADYWAYVRPTLEGLKQVVPKSEASLAEAEDQTGTLSTFGNTIMTIGQKLGGKYESYQTGDEASKSIDLDEFNAKYSVANLERLRNAAQLLADI